MTENEPDYSSMRRVVALTIAGSDSGERRYSGRSARLPCVRRAWLHRVAALTAQNPFGVRGI